MSNKITFAIIGCGNIAQRHAMHISQVGQLIAVCDIVKENADILAAKYHVTPFYRIEDLLEHGKAEVIVICTPNGLHAVHSIKSLEAGCHVLCEKPMAINTIDCQAMIAAAEKSGKRLFIIKQNRYNPPVAALKKIIDDGTLGKIFSLQLNCFWNRHAKYYKDSWKGTHALDGGTLFTQFSHFIDLLYWMVGDIEEVKAYMVNANHKSVIEFEDTGVVILHFKSGTIGTMNYTVNSYDKNMEGSLSIFGEKGTIKIGGEYLNELTYQQIKDYVIDSLPPGKKANEYGNYSGSMSNHDQVYLNLLAVLQHNAGMTTSAFEGMKTVEIINKIYKSAVVYE